MKINELIAQRRSELHLTLEDIANAVGVSKSTVKKWESGYIKNMRRDKMALLAQILQLSPLDLLEREEPSKDNKIIPQFNFYATDTEQRVIKDFRKLSPEGKKSATDYIKFILNQEAHSQGIDKEKGSDNTCSF